MKKVSNSKNIGMSQFHAFSKIVDDIDDEENDSSKCSTAASKNA